MASDVNPQWQQAAYDDMVRKRNHLKMQNTIYKDTLNRIISAGKHNPNKNSNWMQQIASESIIAAGKI